MPSDGLFYEFGSDDWLELLVLFGCLFFTVIIHFNKTISFFITFIQIQPDVHERNLIESLLIFLNQSH